MHLRRAAAGSSRLRIMLIYTRAETARFGTAAGKLLLAAGARAVSSGLAGRRWPIHHWAHPIRSCGRQIASCGRCPGCLFGPDRLPLDSPNLISLFKNRPVSLHDTGRFIFGCLITVYRRHAHRKRSVSLRASAHTGVAISWYSVAFLFSLRGKNWRGLPRRASPSSQ